MRAIDLKPTGGKEPPQLKPGKLPGEYTKLPVNDLVPVQTVRHRHKQAIAKQKISSGVYTPIVVDKNNRIINGHHRYDALKDAGETVAKIYKLDTTIGEVL